MHWVILCYLFACKNRNIGIWMYPNRTLHNLLLYVYEFAWLSAQVNVVACKIHPTKHHACASRHGKQLCELEFQTFMHTKTSFQLFSPQNRNQLSILLVHTVPNVCFTLSRGYEKWKTYPKFPSIKSTPTTVFRRKTSTDCWKFAKKSVH